MLPAKRQALEGSAVKASFWIGGIALVALKGLAFMLSRSNLVRASMFESLGDVLSSFIMAVTQWKVADERDRHLYPVGKRRLTPLGILFFSAFAVSTMSSMAIDSMQVLASEPEHAGDSASVALRRLFEEKPTLRNGLGQDQVDNIIAQYGADDADESSSLHTPVLLLATCIAIKGVLLVWCSYVAVQTGSDISKTLAQDHRNDVISNFMVVLIMVLLDLLRSRGCDWSWLDKIDPASSLLLALWIIYGWLKTALEQITVLSNRRADTETVEVVTAAARKHLEDGPLQLTFADLYHIGEGYEARLQVCVRPGKNLSADQIAAALDMLEAAVRGADHEVYEVHAKLRHSEQNGADFSWAAQYSGPPAAPSAS